jgi:hypothetical protein
VAADEVEVLARQRVTVAAIGASTSLVAAGVLAMLALTVGFQSWPSLAAPVRDPLVLPASRGAGDRPRSVFSPAPRPPHAAPLRSRRAGPAGVRARPRRGPDGRRRAPSLPRRRPAAAPAAAPPPAAVSAPSTAPPASAPAPDGGADRPQPASRVPSLPERRPRGRDHSVGRTVERAAGKVRDTVGARSPLPPPVAGPGTAASDAVAGAGGAAGRAVERPVGIVGRAVERPVGIVGRAVERPAAAAPLP